MTIDANDPGDLRPEDLAGWLAHWTAELDDARREQKPWKDETRRIEARLRDEDKPQGARNKESRWNLYAAGVARKKAILFSGHEPEVKAARKHADADDDVARVAGVILERAVNADVRNPEVGFVESAKEALFDRLAAAGFGLQRHRYVRKASEQGVDTECVESEHVHCEDMLWSPARKFRLLRWWAQQIPMTRAALRDFAGADIAKAAPLNYQRPRDERQEAGQNEHGRRAAVWELWDKDGGELWHFIEGFQIIKRQPDPYGLPGFWPFPKPLAANLTNSKYLPRSDYKIVEDLHLELDEICTRIRKLVHAMKAKGIYPAQAGEDLQRLIDEADERDLVPVANWEMFAEKGGLDGMISWLPLQAMAAALQQLREQRRELIDAIYQITGESDLMRGQATQAGATATEQRIKAQFGSIHMKETQDDFARFLADSQGIRAHLIGKFFEPKAILERANVRHLADARQQQLVSAAIDLIKSGQFQFRVELKPESVSVLDFAAKKEERTELAIALGNVAQLAPALGAVLPPQIAGQVVLETMKFVGAGLKGANEFEGVLDQALAAARQPQPQQQQAPDPKVVAEQMKLQGVQMKTQADMQKQVVKHQQDMERIGAEVQADAMREENQRVQNTREAADKMLIARALKPQPVGGTQ